MQVWPSLIGFIEVISLFVWEWVGVLQLYIISPLRIEVWVQIVQCKITRFRKLTSDQHNLVLHSRVIHFIWLGKKFKIVEIPQSCKRRSCVQLLEAWRVNDHGWQTRLFICCLRRLKTEERPWSPYNYNHTTIMVSCLCACNTIGTYTIHIYGSSVPCVGRYGSHWTCIRNY